MTAITIEHLGKRFGDADAVRDLSLEIPSGAFVVLLGPSGCGKTTTLRMLAGLEEPTSGRIRFDERIVADGDRGTGVPAQARGLGMVFQSYALWPHMTARENIEWPLTVAGWGRADRRRRADEVLARLEIRHLADRTPAEVSGGQQQRIAIARTIAPNPGVLLFDEPLSNLDARLRVETRAELGALHRDHGATSVYVTHDQTEALALATHIAVMRDGRLEQFGTPAELLDRPATAFVAGFLGTPPAVLLEGRMREGALVRELADPDARDARRAVLADDIAPRTGAEPTHAMFRPEDIRLGEAGTLPFEVIESTPTAGVHLVTGFVPPHADGERSRVTVVSPHLVATGTTTRLELPAVPAGLFDANGARIEAGTVAS